jgi:fructose-bisphosphate aldolase class II
MRSMKSLRETVAWAQKEKVAIGHFNISTLDALWGIFRAAQEKKLPVIIGVSEGERDFVGVRQAVALVQSLRTQFDYPIFLNADHTYSLERCKEAIDAGYDSVIFDGAKLSFEENVKTTKAVVEYARASGRDVLVEAELGYIGTSSKVLDELPAGAALSEGELTTVEDAVRFVQETGIDLFAPAIGSVHGMLRTMHDPDLNTVRIKEIADALPKVPLVLHGGSGLRDENVKEGVVAGIRIAHVNTEIRVAWKNAVKLALQSEEDEVAPYKILRSAESDVQKLVEKKLELFGGR